MLRPIHSIHQTMDLGEISSHRRKPVPMLEIHTMTDEAKSRSALLTEPPVKRGEEGQHAEPWSSPPD
jgi:hypothetical protein